jgi:hypothetical protein
MIEMRGTIPMSVDWPVPTAEVKSVPSGIPILICRLKRADRVQIEWIQFE